MHVAQCFGEFLGRRVLEQVTLDAGVERAAQVTLARKRGDDDHLAGQGIRLDALREFDARHAGHFDVGDDDVRSQPPALGQRLHAVSGGAEHFDVALHLQQCAQCAAHHGLVLGEQDADHAATGTDARSTVPPSLLGASCSVPPTLSSRSRMPLSPLPGTMRPPCPSSATSTTTVFASFSTRMLTPRAPEWRRILVAASRNDSASAVSRSCGSLTLSASQLTLSPWAFNSAVAAASSADSAVLRIPVMARRICDRAS